MKLRITLLYAITFVLSTLQLNSFAQIYPGETTVKGASSSFSSQIPSNLFMETGGLRIGGSNGPFHKLHLSDGNIFVEGGGETGLMFKRLGTNADSPGPDGVQTNPIFYWGRVSKAGDGSWESKMMFSSDETPERVISKWDSKGILAMIQPNIRGRSVEGYLIDGHSMPWFGISSENVNHRLEFGPGGMLDDMDVGLVRVGTQSLCLAVGPGSQSLQCKVIAYGDSLAVQNGVSLVMPEFATAPSAPGAGGHKLYFKDDKNIYTKQAGGIERKLPLALTVDAVGGEDELQIDELDLVANRHYDFAITATNHTAATNNYSITANEGAITITTFSVAGLSNSLTLHIELSLNATSDGSKYLAYEVFKVGGGSSSGYSGLITNVTSIELKASTSGTVGAHSFLQMKG